MRKFILFCFAIASVHFCYAKDPIIHLSSKKNPIIVHSKKINIPDRMVTLAIETRGKKFNFINYNTIAPRLYSKAEHRFLKFSMGVDASRPPDKSDVLNLNAKSKHYLSLYLQFRKSKNTLYFTYFDSSGLFYIADLKKGIYDLSFRYSVDNFKKDSYPESNKNLLWKKSLKSNSIELRIE